jgi:hypothetical protein
VFAVGDGLRLVDRRRDIVASDARIEAVILERVTAQAEREGDLEVKAKGSGLRGLVKEVAKRQENEEKSNWKRTRGKKVTKLICVGSLGIREQALPAFWV